MHPWRFHAHPEVWVLMVAIIVAYWYFLVRVGPNVDRGGEPVVTKRQLSQFIAGWLILWIGADYPIHDLGEGYLFSVHMYQHMLFSLVAPGLLLLGIPNPLAGGKPFRFANVDNNKERAGWLTLGKIVLP